MAKEGVADRNRGFAKALHWEGGIIWATIGYTSLLLHTELGAKCDNWVEIVTLWNKMGFKGNI